MASRTLGGYSVRVEGRIALKLHGFKNADVAARAIANALDEARERWADEDENAFRDPYSRDVEVVGIDLVQVEELPAEAV